MNAMHIDSTEYEITARHRVTFDIADPEPMIDTSSRWNRDTGTYQAVEIPVLPRLGWITWHWSRTEEKWIPTSAGLTGHRIKKDGNPGRQVRTIGFLRARALLPETPDWFREPFINCAPTWAPSGSLPR